MTQIPCKQDRCILLPICLTKEEISCPILESFIHMLDYGMTNDELWKVVNKDLPKLTILHSEISANGHHGYPSRRTHFAYSLEEVKNEIKSM